MNSAWTRSCSKEILRDAHTSKQIPKTFALPHRFSNLLRSFMSAVSAWRDGKGRQSRVKTAAMSKIKKYYWLLQTRFLPMWVTSKYLKYDLIYQGLHGSRVSLELIIDDTESTVKLKSVKGGTSFPTGPSGFPHATLSRQTCSQWIPWGQLCRMFRHVTGLTQKAFF